MSEGSPLTGSVSQGDLYDTYEGIGGPYAIKDLNLLDESGNNIINATNKINNNLYYYSFAIDNSYIQTGDGNDEFNINNYRGYYAVGLQSSTLNSGQGSDKIIIELLEDRFVYGAFGLENSEINTGSGDDEVEITITSSKDDAFTSYAVKNSSIELGEGNDNLNISQNNSSGNLDIAISGEVSYSVLYDFGSGDDVGSFYSEGYGIKSDGANRHKVVLGEGDDSFNISSVYSSFYKSILYANEGNDQIDLRASNQTHYGIEDSDIYLGDGDDYLTLDSSKNSNIDGGAGTDSIKILDSSENYIIENLQSNNFEITNSSDGFFKLSLSNVEQISFNDKNISLLDGSDYGNLVIRGNSIYTIIEGPSWTEAEANANKLGGNLITINDKEEYSWGANNIWSKQNYISKGLNADTLSYVGFNDKDNEGSYRWSSGEVTDWNDLTDLIHAQNWFAQQQWFNGWDYGMIFANADFEIEGADERYTPYQNRGGIVLMDNDASFYRDHGQNIAGIAESSFIRRNDSAYVIVEGPSWEEAEANANKLGGHLVTINDADENQWLVDNFNAWTWEDKWNDHYQWGQGIAEIKLAPNNSPTGLPKISGKFKIGEILTADISLITDQDNFQGYTPTYSYSWKSSEDNKNWMEIGSSSSYKLTDSETYDFLRLDISYVDGYGTIENLSTNFLLQIGNSGDNNFSGSSNKDKIYGGSGNDRLVGGRGNDILNGGLGNDHLVGGAGVDKLFGNAGNDVLRGGGGNDRLVGGAGLDKLFGNAGNDVLRGGGGNDRLVGGAGVDKLFGNAGNDVLRGGGGNDRLVGGDGIDRLTGGVGSDIIIGGSGNDIFQINSGIGRDVITDYEVGNDRIKLLGGQTENELTFSYVGGHTRIKDDEGDLLAIVQNTIAEDITFI